MNDYKTKKLAEFQDKFTLNKEGLELSVNATAYILKQFISDLIDEMESNAFLKDIVKQTRIDTLRQVLPKVDRDNYYSVVDIYLEDKAKELWGIELNNLNK